MMKRVAFVINFNKDSWLGGFNYFKNLFIFLHEFNEKKITPIIITDDIRKVEEIVEQTGNEVLVSKLFSNSSFIIRIVNKLLILLFGKNIYLESFFKKNNISALSHSGFTGKKSKIKSFPWFPDFQELYFPENFSKRNLFFRRLDVFFSKIHSTRIIVSSQQVQNDLKKINFSAYNHSNIIKHYTHLPKKENLISLSELKGKYRFEKNYFFLPNHYWTHKNHILVLKAINLIKEKFNCIIISTGQIHDHRNPENFNKIKEYINKNNLSKFYKILGIIPFTDVISFMLNSIALINSSKSEGWSNTVEQAKSLGIKILLSDIKVHREQANNNCNFFDPNDENKLGKLFMSLNLKNPNEINYEDCQKKLKHMQEEFVKNYQNFIYKYIA